MTQVTIYRCPESPAVLYYTDELIATLTGQDVAVAVEDGKRGQFRVVLDGEPIFTQQGDILPAVEEIGEAVSEAGMIGLAI